MILDQRTELADAVSLNTGAAGIYLIGSQIDLTTPRDIGNGEPIYLVVSVDTGIEAASAGTIQFILASDAQAAIATDGSATVHNTSPAIATSTTTDTTTLIPGTILYAVPLALEGNTYERYLGVLQVTGTAAITAGKVNVFLTTDVQKWKAYANAI